MLGADPPRLDHQAAWGQRADDVVGAISVVSTASLWTAGWSTGPPEITSGTEIHALIEKFYKTPPAIVDRIKTILEHTAQ